MKKLFGYQDIILKNKAFIRISILIFSIVIYYKNKYGIKIAFAIHNIVFELSVTNWKYSPIHEVLDEFTEKE